MRLYLDARGCVVELVGVLPYHTISCLDGDTCCYCYLWTVDPVSGDEICGLDGRCLLIIQKVGIMSGDGICRYRCYIFDG